MGVWDTIQERHAGQSPAYHSVGSRRGGLATVKYMCTAEQRQEAMRTAIELVRENLDGQETGLLRQPPVAVPEEPWLYITDVAAVGVSYDSRVDSLGSLAVLEAPAARYNAKYLEYELTCQASSRPYAIIADENLGDELIDWTKDDGTPGGQIRAAREWNRNVEWLPEPGAEFITADIGLFQFKRTGGGGAAGLPAHDQSSGRGGVKILVPSTTWRVVWHLVPFRWLTARNNVFDRLKGRVNQMKFCGFDPGTLLFANASLADPPTPQPFPAMATDEDATYPSQEKVCNVVMTFVEKNPPKFEAYTTSNASFIAAGHNLVPYAKTGKWYYVETRGDAGSGIASEPIYRSAPFQFLFCNPDRVPSF